MNSRRVYDVAYLLFSGGGLKDVIHKHWKQFRHSMHAGSEGSILCRAIDRLTVVFGLVNPSASYGIYNVEHS